MILTKSSQDLDALLSYLAETERIGSGYCDLIRIVHDPENDKNNQQDPRAFAFAISTSNVIHGSKALELICPRARLGILLHEIGHVVLNAFDGDVSEVDVDEWCMFQVAESGYRYHTLHYPSPWEAGVIRKADNVQHVDLPFAELLARR
jgi:hypothetical protein